MGRGREEQLELSLGKQIGIIYNISDVKATTKTMLQKEAAKTFKQLNAYTHEQSICVWERERGSERDTRTWWKMRRKAATEMREKLLENANG